MVMSQREVLEQHLTEKIEARKRLGAVRIPRDQRQFYEAAPDIERVRKAIKHYEPITPPRDWSRGFVENHARNENGFGVAMGLTSIVAALGLFVLLIGIASSIGQGVVDSVLPRLLGIGFITAISSCLALLFLMAWRRAGRWRDYDTGAWRDEISVYTRPMPVDALVAYDKARRTRLFDAIQVYSPSSDDFGVLNRRVATSDPLLIGHIGQAYHFLIAYWGLDGDLELVKHDEQPTATAT